MSTEIGRKLGTAINDNFDNDSLTLDSRLAAANGGEENFFSGDLNKLVEIINPEIQLESASQVTGFDTEVDDRIAAQKGAANGIAELDSNSQLVVTQLPADLSTLPTHLPASTDIFWIQQLISGNYVNKYYTYSQLLAALGPNISVSAGNIFDLGLYALLVLGGAMQGAIINYTDTPTQDLELVPKIYVDTLAAGLSPKTSCRVATTANLSATYNNGSSGVGATLTNSGAQAALVIDGITLAVTDRVLVKNQSTQAQNGIYVVSNVGSVSTNWVLTRASDFDNSPNNEISEGDYTIISEGTTNATNMFVETGTGPFTVGTTAIIFSAFNSAANINAGTGLTKSGNTLSISNVITSGSAGAANSVPAITYNAQGQITAVTPTTISITSSNVSNFSSAVSAIALMQGKHSEMIMLGGINPALTNGVTIQQVESGTNKNNYRGWYYVNGSATYAHLQYPLPKSWDGANITLRPYFITSLIGVGQFTFNIQTCLRNNGSLFDSAFSSANAITTSINNADAYTLNIGAETALTLGGAAFSFPSMLEIRIGRSATDTGAAPAILVGVQLNLTLNAGNDA